MLARLLDRILRVLADKFGMYVMPFSCVLLPWPMAFRMLRCYAAIPVLFCDAVEVAWLMAKDYSHHLDEKTWKQRFRLLRMVDQADIYLTLTRGERWRRRYIAQSGDWPACARACMFLTYHWGAGNWVWPLLRAHGFSAYFLARRPHGRLLGTTLLAHWYGIFRVWALRRIGSAGIILTGGSGSAIVDALRKGESVVGMLDLPAAERQQTLEFSLLERRVRLPVGLAQLATETSARIVVFSFGLNFASGRRTLNVETLPVGIALDAAMQFYVLHLQARLYQSPESWHMWHEARTMFVAAAPDQT